MSCIAICGDSASGKTVMANLLAVLLRDSVVLECDRYHLWERNNPIWQKEFTHLNPAANNIHLMNLDVYELKKGTTIYRPNYDHRTGTFTDPVAINPADHIIVSGLHTFMCPESMYDLKIFMDPSDELKIQWKINRDISNRGYTYEQVKEQIERRKSDYETFVLPLRSRADIVVNNFDDPSFNYVWQQVQKTLSV